MSKQKYDKLDLNGEWDRDDRYLVKKAWVLLGLLRKGVDDARSEFNDSRVRKRVDALIRSFEGRDGAMPLRDIDKISKSFDDVPMKEVSPRYRLAGEAMRNLKFSSNVLKGAMETMSFSTGHPDGYFKERKWLNQQKTWYKAMLDEISAIREKGEMSFVERIENLLRGAMMHLLNSWGWDGSKTMNLADDFHLTWGKGGMIMELVKQVKAFKEKADDIVDDASSVTPQPTPTPSPQTPTPTPFTPTPTPSPSPEPVVDRGGDPDYSISTYYEGEKDFVGAWEEYDARAEFFSGTSKRKYKDYKYF